jgi:hypothetical protein
MSAAALPSMAETTDAPQDSGPGRPKRHRRRVVAGMAVVAAVAGVVTAVRPSIGRTGRAKSTTVDNAALTSAATIVARPLSSQQQVSATLGYAGSYDVVNQTKGTLTALPPIGRVVTQGQTLYQVDGTPVVLLDGPTPAYRSLFEGAKASDVTGPDVQELNADLVALGYATRAQLDPTSNQFSYQTKAALEKLQAHLGVAKTGVLTLGQAVFLPSSARITAVPASVTLGAPANPGATILQATSTTPVVTIALDAAQQSDVKVGNPVTITLPNHQTTPGMVSSVGTVATAGSSSSPPTVEVIVTPTVAAAIRSLDRAPVQVAITTASVESALVVPVTALLALSTGGYAVEEVTPAGVRHLVPVSLGLFDDADGLVQVSGTGLSAGQQVVVPAS